MKDLNCFVGLCGGDHKKLQYVEPPVFSSHVSATSPSTRSFSERSWYHLMNPGNNPSCIQDQRSVRLLDRVDIQCITADGSQFKCIFLSSDMHLLNRSAYFLEGFGCRRWIHACIFLSSHMQSPSTYVYFPPEVSGLLLPWIIIVPTILTYR